jgi:prevent-host-death family protein
VPRNISQRELRNDSGEIMRQVEAGESFIVTRNGVPTAQLVPLKRRAWVPRNELVASAKHLPHLDFARFRADIDAVVDPWVR